MKVRYFFVHEFTPETTRERPIGAWIVQEGGGFDYVFSPDYPDDEQRASDVVNRILDSGESTVVPDFLDYWQTHMGYTRSATEIIEEDVADYAKFYADLTRKVV